MSDIVPPAPCWSRRAIGRAGGATLLGAAGARHARAAEARLTEGSRPLPEIAFVDGEGRAHAPAAFRGRGLVINLWATWCAPCVAEMPSLDRAQAALEGDGVLVLALSSDRGGRDQVAAFYREHGIGRLGLWLDPRGAAGRALGARGLPTTIIVDRGGQERARLEGSAEWDTPAMLAAVRRLTVTLPGPGPGPGPGAAARA